MNSSKPIQPFIEIAYEQTCKQGQNACGDLFLSQRVKEESRVISVLADGLGSGIKASVLSIVTGAMATACIRGNMDAKRTAETILRSLPICKERGLAYATFTIVDIDIAKNEMRVIEHENPRFILIRDNLTVRLGDETMPIKNASLPGRCNELRLTKFRLQKNDRIVFFSDGITQAGLGMPSFPQGWGRGNACKAALELVQAYPDISARSLALKISQRAMAHDGYAAKDDMTCAVMYYRQPRRMLVVTGPPYDPVNDSFIARKIEDFPGRTMVCGGTTAALVARELGRQVQIDYQQSHPAVPPASKIEGIDLVTEGTLTLEEMLRQLKYKKRRPGGEDAAARATAMLLRSDQIHFVVGSRVNNAHQDPGNPKQLDLRRNMIQKIRGELEGKYLKETSMELI